MLKALLQFKLNDASKAIKYVGQLAHVPTCGTTTLSLNLNFIRTSRKQISKPQKISKRQKIFQNSIAKTNCIGKIFMQLKQFTAFLTISISTWNISNLQLLLKRHFIKLHFLYDRYALKFWRNCRQRVISLLAENQQKRISVALLLIR